VSVGRGTSDAFQRFGAPWLNAVEVARLLNDRKLGGVRFVVDSFAPQNPGDGKYGGRRIAGIRIDVTDRNAIRSGRISAAILWSLARVNRDSLKLTERVFDERFGSSAARAAIMGGSDPDEVMDRQQSAVASFLQSAARYRLYH
jgi:uncharacterized protein YbbC (DUF1343 family)